MISAKNTPAATAPVIDHFGFTVEPWSLDSVETALKERRLTVRLSRNDPHDASGKSAFTRDPNGYNVRLCARDLETKPAAVASRAPLKAVGINHISYLCTDYKKTRDFYTGLLGAPVSKRETWPCVFQNSEMPTSAVARPPNAWENAMRSGIFVIGIEAEIAVPNPAPRTSPAMIHS